MRDAVEAALSDVILLGTDEQVRLAAQAAADLAGGRHVHTAALVISLRTFIREVLELDPIPDGLTIPDQGPARGAAGGTRGGRSEAAGGAGAEGAEAEPQEPVAQEPGSARWPVRRRTAAHRDAAETPSEFENHGGVAP